MWVPTDYFMEQVLLQLSECEASAPFSGVLCGVYVGLATGVPPGLNRSTVLAQFTEAVFPGYARLPLTWRLPYFGTNGLWNLEADCVHWQPTANLAGQIQTSVFVASALSGGQLLLADVFPGPGVDLSNVQDALTMIVRYGFDPTGNYAGYVVVD